MTGWDDAGQVPGARDAFVEDWERLFTANPKILWGLVADVAKAVKANEGERKTGRRPGVTVSSLDELYMVLFPDTYADVPFPEALTKALGSTSQHKFAERVGYNQATVSRLVSGKIQPSVETMERIAQTLGIRPTYFVEYRAMKLGQIVTTVLLNNPYLSMERIRGMAGERA